MIDENWDGTRCWQDYRLSKTAVISGETLYGCLNLIFTIFTCLAVNFQDTGFQHDFLNHRNGDKHLYLKIWCFFRSISLLELFYNNFWGVIKTSKIYPTAFELMCTFHIPQKSYTYGWTDTSQPQRNCSELLSDCKWHFTSNWGISYRLRSEVKVALVKKFAILDFVKI